MRLHRLLLATDFGPSARAAADQARELALVSGAEVVLAHAIPVPSRLSQVSTESYLLAERRCAELRGELEAAGVRVSPTVAVRYEDPEVWLAGAARELKVDLVLAGRGRLPVGPTAAAMALRVACPLWLVPRGRWVAPEGIRVELAAGTAANLLPLADELARMLELPLEVGSSDPLLPEDHSFLAAAGLTLQPPRRGGDLLHLVGGSELDLRWGDEPGPLLRASLELAGRSRLAAAAADAPSAPTHPTA